MEGVHVGASRCKVLCMTAAHHVSCVAGKEGVFDSNAFSRLNGLRSANSMQIARSEDKCKDMHGTIGSMMDCLAMMRLHTA